VLLLDEPLGALDAKLRHQLQDELKTLQQRVGITFVYVTHDQEEALTMSDQIAVMSQGLVEQVGTPREVYEEPTTEFVADFLGISNLLGAELVSVHDGECRLQVGEFTLKAHGGDASLRGSVKCVVRPERVRVRESDARGENCVPGEVERLVYLGSATRVMVRLATGETLQSLIQSDGQPLPFDRGIAVQVELPADALRVLHRSTTTGGDAAATPGGETEGASIGETALHGRVQ
jgi:spermidine/putrescine transport system ATP-binding protein